MAQSVALWLDEWLRPPCRRGAETDLNRDDRGPRGAGVVEDVEIVRFWMEISETMAPSRRAWNKCNSHSKISDWWAKLRFLHPEG
jgi:hypothetical protein